MRMHLIDISSYQTAVYGVTDWPITFIAWSSYDLNHSLTERVYSDLIHLNRLA